MNETAEKKEIFESMPVPQALRLMAVPMVISQLIVLIYNMADTFYVGRTNDPYMVAGISMMLPVFNITISLAGISGVGGGTLISRLLGKGQEQEARKVSAFSVYLAIALAAVFSVGMLLFMDPLLRLVGAGENTIVYAQYYTFCVLVIGGIPTVLSNVLSNL
ncbi:MAG: MATE family efflux transporter, partial [Lachnospiraceae bacterium]|nr:MATE family efflux transporter [Lachnospiraceae bacterium]